MTRYLAEFRPALIVIALFALGALLVGCGFTGTGDAFRAGVATKGAQAMDEGLSNAEWFLCSAASVGSVQRRYSKSPELSRAWRDLCLSDKAAVALPE